MQAHRNLRPDLLSLAPEVRRIEGGRGPKAEGTGARERPAEADHRRQGAGVLDAEGPSKVKMVSPARRREAIKHLVQRFHVSERRACRVLAQHRSTQRYQPVPVDYEQGLVKRMNELAAEHPRWGYRTITTLLVGEGWRVNLKRSVDSGGWRVIELTGSCQGGAG